MSRSASDLDMPGWTVRAVGDGPAGPWVDAAPVAAVEAECPVCGGPTAAHGPQPQEIRDHVPGLGPAVIRFMRARRRCRAPDCRAVVSGPVPGRSGRHPRLTARLVDLVVDRLRGGASDSEAAAAAGISRPVVAEIRADAGLPGRAAGRPRKNAEA